MMYGQSISCHAGRLAGTIMVYCCFGYSVRMYSV